MKKISLLLIVSLLSVTVSFSQADPKMKSFIDALMKKMTLEEKIGQLNLPSSGDITTGQAQSSDIAKEIREGKVGGLFNIKSVAKIKDVQRVAPLHPQNHQLIDISNDKMQLLYDMPLPLGEPHYAVSIAANKLKPAVRYKVGTDSRTDEPHPLATKAGEEKIVKKGNTVDVYATLIRSHITPETIEVDVGDDVAIHLTNLERAQDETHGFTVSTYNTHASVEPGKTVSVKFKADKEGVYPYYCTEFCSALHLEMQGYLLIPEVEGRCMADERLGEHGHRS